MKKKKKLRKTGHGARARPDEAKLRAQHEARDASALLRETVGPDRTQDDEAPVSGEAEPAPYDEALLDAARTQWQFGDWMSLAALDTGRIQHHPERARLALLAAAGRFQCADLNEAHRYIRLAQDWGISSGLVEQVLISGTHNLLGCVRAALGSHEKAGRHFADAVRFSGVRGDMRLLTRIREEWQMTAGNTREDSTWKRNP